MYLFLFLLYFFAEAKLVAKFQAAAHALQPLLMQEVENHQIQKFLITGALDHFANTVNAIADKFEGKADSEYVSLSSYDASYAPRGRDLAFHFGITFSRSARTRIQNETYIILKLSRADS